MGMLQGFVSSEKIHNNTLLFSRKKWHFREMKLYHFQSNIHFKTTYTMREEMNIVSLLLSKQKRMNQLHIEALKELTSPYLFLQRISKQSYKKTTLERGLLIGFFIWLYYLIPTSKLEGL
jgi:hypothetical protein